MSKSRFKIIFEGQEIEMESGFVGGFIHGEGNFPMGMYSGNLLVEDTFIALTHILRSVIKMNTEEQDLNIEQSQKLIEMALAAAISSEIEKKSEDNMSLEEHKEIVIKMKRNSDIN